MRNLSKVLALVLALVLAFGMLSAGAASFTDSKDITATEAVDMLSTLGVINGYPDGTFNPNGTVTRAEMAKMIFTIRNGGNSDASAYASMATPFKDVVGHWAKGYINYCYTMGIVNGKSATSFDPNAPVTGLEAAKMALVCLGYNAQTAGLTGLGWDQKTAALATDAGLFADYNTAITAGAPRQLAAQLLYNALFADTVRLVDGVYETKAPDSGVKYGTLGNKYMSLDTWEGILTGTGNNGASNKEGFDVTVVKKNDVTLTSAESKYFEYKDVDLSSLKNQYVKVTTGKNEKVYGVYAVADKNFVVKTTYDKVTDFVANTSVKIDGTKYDLESTGFAYSATPADADTVIFIDNDGDKKFNTATVIQTSVGKVTFVGTDSVTVTKVSGTFNLTAANQDFDDVVSYSGIAKDDYVIAQRNAYLAKDAFTKAEILSGTVTGTKTEDSVQKYLVDGKWYKFASNYSTAPTIKAGDAIDYVSIGGVIYYAKKTSGASGVKDLAVLVKAELTASGGTTGQKVEGVLAFADGTTKTAIIDKVTIDGGTPNSIIDGKDDVSALLGVLVTYKYDNDGNVELENVTSANKAGYDDVTANSTVTTSDKDNTIGGVEVADDAVIFVFYGDQTATAQASINNDCEVISGKEFKRINNSSGNIIAPSNAGAALIAEDNGFNNIAVAAVKAGTSGYSTADEKFTLGITGAGNYGYLVADSYYSYEGGKDYYNFPIWDGSKTLTVKEQTSTSKYFEAGSLIAFDIISEGLVKNVEDVTKQVAVTGYNGEKVQIGGEGTYKITSDTVILYVDSKDKEGVTGGSISVAGEPLTEGVYVKNAIIDKYNVGGTDLEVIVVDVNNELDGAGTYPTTWALTNSNPTIAAAAPAGGYSVSMPASAAAGSTVTVTITCTTAPTSGTDTITVTPAGVTPVTTTFTTTGTQTVTFTMPNADTAVATSVTNA